MHQTPRRLVEVSFLDKAASSLTSHGVSSQTSFFFLAHKRLSSKPGCKLSYHFVVVVYNPTIPYVTLPLSRARVTTLPSSKRVTRKKGNGKNICKYFVVSFFELQLCIVSLESLSLLQQPYFFSISTQQPK